MSTHTTAAHATVEATSPQTIPAHTTPQMPNPTNLLETGSRRRRTPSPALNDRWVRPRLSGSNAESKLPHEETYQSQRVCDGDDVTMQDDWETGPMTERSSADHSGHASSARQPLPTPFLATCTDVETCLNAPGTLWCGVHAMHTGPEDKSSEIFSLDADLSGDSPVVTVDLGRLGSVVLQVAWGDHVCTVARIALMQLSHLECCAAYQILRSCDAWTEDLKIALAMVSHPIQTVTLIWPSVIAAGLYHGFTLYVRGHEHVNAEGQSLAQARCARPLELPLEWPSGLASRLHLLSQEDLPVEWEDPRAELQFDRMHASRREAEVRAENLSGMMYEDVPQHETLWCGGHAVADAKAMLDTQPALLRPPGLAVESPHDHTEHGMVVHRRSTLFRDVGSLHTLRLPSVVATPTRFRAQRFAEHDAREGLREIRETLYSTYTQTRLTLGPSTFSVVVPPGRVTAPLAHFLATEVQSMMQSFEAQI